MRPISNFKIDSRELDWEGVRTDMLSPAAPGAFPAPVSR